MELGIYTLAETTRDPETGHTVGAEQRLRELLEEVELADQLGLDVYGVGEHHRPDYAGVGAGGGARRGGGAYPAYPSDQCRDGAELR